MKRFEKKGCPQRKWDGQDGCPAWIEMPVATRGNPQHKEVKGQCLDLWLWEFQWAALGLLEGNQQATEESRNMMALFSLVSCGQQNPAELARIAKKHLDYRNDSDRRPNTKNTKKIEG